MTDRRDEQERMDEAGGGHIDGEIERGDEADDVEADNPVEEDTLKTIDPDNAPA